MPLEAGLLFAFAVHPSGFDGIRLDLLKSKVRIERLRLRRSKYPADFLKFWMRKNALHKKMTKTILTQVFFNTYIT